MNKDLLNRYFRKFGFEVHGTGHLQKLQKSSFREDAFEKQQQIAGTGISTIFDIGANRGDTVLHYHSTFPLATIYAFEPFPDSFQIMADRVGNNKNVFLFQKAVGEKMGKNILYVNNSVDTNSLLPSKETGLSSDKMVANKGQIEVEVNTIDQFCADNHIEYIDILKMDIQGGELAALKGCERMLSTKKVGLIYTETYFVQQYEGHPLFHDLTHYLQQHAYQLQDLYNPYYGKGSIAWCDAIYLPAG